MPVIGAVVASAVMVLEGLQTVASIAREPLRNIGHDRSKPIQEGAGLVFSDLSVTVG
jgi:hypothetical protein